MTEASRHFVLLRSCFFLSDRRVPPGECGFTSSDGNPGTNGAVTKLAAERGINAKSAILQAPKHSTGHLCLWGAGGHPAGRLRHQPSETPVAERPRRLCSYPSMISSGNSFAFADVLGKCAASTLPTSLTASVSAWLNFSF
jgi:hypothetical protein